MSIPPIRRFCKNINTINIGINTINAPANLTGVEEMAFTVDVE